MEFWSFIWISSREPLRRDHGISPCGNTSAIKFQIRLRRIFKNGQLDSSDKNRLKEFENRAAKAFVQNFDGEIPSDLEQLRKLPGIGPYTAGAIAAFAFDKPVPVLDANILRVVARLFDFQSDITTAAGRQFLEKAAASLLPKSEGRNHTSALMDLGATICKSGPPDCLLCPVENFCRASEPASLPIKPRKKEITALVEWRALAIRRNRIFLIPSPGPRWKGLWLLPPAEPTDAEPILSLNYAITRYKVRLHLRESTPEPNWHPFPLNQLPPMPSPHRHALAKWV